MAKLYNIIIFTLIESKGKLVILKTPQNISSYVFLIYDVKNTEIQDYIWGVFYWFSLTSPNSEWVSLTKGNWIGFKIANLSAK